MVSIAIFIVWYKKKNKKNTRVLQGMSVECDTNVFFYSANFFCIHIWKCTLAGAFVYILRGCARVFHEQCENEINVFCCKYYPCIVRQAPFLLVRENLRGIRDNLTAMQLVKVEWENIHTKLDHLTWRARDLKSAVHFGASLIRAKKHAVAKRAGSRHVVALLFIVVVVVVENFSIFCFLFLWEKKRLW